VIPKHHGEKLTDVPDAYLADMLPLARRVATALRADNYNLLQNNGALAHQVREHAVTERKRERPDPGAQDYKHVGVRAQMGKPSRA
jgi:hypothetical protein